MITPASRILVVDDFELVHMQMKVILNELGYSKISDCKNGRQAWVAMTAAVEAGQAFDLVFCDWNMPDMNGIELLKTVRKDDRTKGTLFLMLTAESEQSYLTEALTAGADNYIVKPFSTEMIKNKIAFLNRKSERIKA